MEALLASLYIYIYDNMYTQKSTYNLLTTYSDAIKNAISPNGNLHNIYLTIRIIAFGILTVYFIIALGTRLESRTASPSIVFKTLLQFFIGYVLAIFSFDIVIWMFQAGDWLGSKILEDTVPDMASLEQFIDTFRLSVKQLEPTEIVLYIFKALLPYLVCLVGNIAIVYIVVTRVIRICVNATLSPIAIANFFEGSRYSDSIRFIKRTMSMGLQCAVIMIITAAVSSFTSYVTTDSIYSDSIKSKNTVVEAKEALMKSRENDYKELKRDVNYAIDKKGLNARTSGGESLKNNYEKARRKLISGSGKVTRGKEKEYKGYEKLIGLEVFEKNGGRYVYNKKGYAQLQPKYMIFSEDTLKTFMNTMLGGGNYFIFVFLMIIRVGMIKKSMSLCNTIVGL